MIILFFLIIIIIRNSRSLYNPKFSIISIFIFSSGQIFSRISYDFFRFLLHRFFHDHFRRNFHFQILQDFLIIKKINFQERLITNYEIYDINLISDFLRITIRFYTIWDLTIFCIISYVRGLKVQNSSYDFFSIFFIYVIDFRSMTSIHQSWWKKSWYYDSKESIKFLFESESWFSY